MAIIHFNGLQGYYLKLSELYLCYSFFSKFVLKVVFLDSACKIYLHDFVDLLFFNFYKNSLFFSYEQLSDLTCVDWLGMKYRFEVVYTLLSMYFNKRMLISSYCGIDLGNVYSVMIPSVIFVYLGANWLERELWDMFGIFFFGHSDLRRLLTDYGFRGFPLRKDFPMSGFLESRYDDNLKAIVSEKIVFMQVYRIFDFTSPWERL